MDKGHVHPKEGLLKETQGIRLLGKKENKGSYRLGIRVVSQGEKNKNEDEQITYFEKCHVELDSASDRIKDLRDPGTKR